MIFYIFVYVFLVRILISVNLRSFKADKGIKFLLPTKSEKNRPCKGLIFRACFSTGTSLKLHISHLALPANGTFRNICLFYLELESLKLYVPKFLKKLREAFFGKSDFSKLVVTLPSTAAYTLYFVFIPFDIADLRKAVLIEHFFYFESYCE